MAEIRQQARPKHCGHVVAGHQHLSIIIQADCQTTDCTHTFGYPSGGTAVLTLGDRTPAPNDTRPAPDNISRVSPPGLGHRTMRMQRCFAG